jgi:hypothetical protein
VAETADHAADPGEFIEVTKEALGIDGAGMERREGKRNAVLIEIVADGNFSAEGVAAMVKVDLVVGVVASLHEYRDAEVRSVDGVDYTNFETEVREADDDTVDFISVLTEKGGAFEPVLDGLDRAASGRGCIFREDYIVIALLVQSLEQGSLDILCECRIKICPGPDDETEAEFFAVLVHGCQFFMLLLFIYH